MRTRLLLVVSVAFLAAGCGSGSHGTVITITTTAPVSPKPMAVTIFVARQGLLQPKLVHVPRAPAIAGAALGALGIAAPVTISGGTATVDLAKATNDQVAEIVYTLTHFPSVQRVDVAGRMGLTRDDFAAYVPPIFVETPVTGAEVAHTFQVSGTASVFDPGWVGNPTLELGNVGILPVSLYPNMRICSFTFETLSSPVDVPYAAKRGNKYAHQTGPLASRYAAEKDPRS